MQNLPRLLSSSVVLGTNSTNGVNVQSLRNPEPGPMLIHEIRWDLHAEGVVPGLTVDLKPSGAIIGCKLSLGEHDLTNGFVPVWNFGKLYTPFYLDTPPLFPRGESSTWGLHDDVVDGVPAGPRASVAYRWKLRHPLFVPNGAVLTPTFENRGGSPGSIESRISYVAQSLPVRTPTPNVVQLPWVAYHASKAFAYAQADFDESGDLDLVNPHKEALSLERFTGRIAYLTASTYGYEDYDGDNQNGGNFGRAVGSRMLRVRMDTSNGTPIVPLPTLFRQVFAHSTRSWELNGVDMAPESFFRAYIAKSVPVEDASGPAERDTMQTFIGLVGWRELRLGGAA
jgi:hypothetical protein